ncbi:hypothetical protein [Cupriavidus neocaledonicus]|uniref:Rap1a immunity protein domain-containing protein n=1 Tax=Cupriavidus neocaledonicus TaxID=1040979 RepID=A0A375H616_9BURK|nr:hypothetical protein [Cupriavidus neocaledonicus]SOZ37014.1 conserved exported hypothetical protein [Cupriavidus neocaledonicus]SPD45590.1 conserved exported protein of unknown function [Cupriavidus neocaledonicus]
MKKTIGCSALVFAMLTTTGHAENVSVLGAVDCGMWVKTRGDSLSGSLHQAWLFGFLSGANAAIGSSYGDPLHGISSDQAVVWVDNYCRNNPLSKLADAGSTLYRELVARKKAR